MKKAVFFDMDGTLWNQKMQIPMSTVTALRALRANGHYAFICSGRSRASICAPRLLDIGFDGILAGCGVYAEYAGSILYEHRLTPAQCQELLAVVDELGIPVIIEGSRDLFADMQMFANDRYVAYLKKELGEHMRDRHEMTEDDPISKMSVECNADAKGQLQAVLGGKYELVFHESSIVEILPKGFSKATGIQKACEMLGIDHADTYAFGDSANDLEMLTFVAHGVAMGNASADAKAAAEYVTTDIDADGIQNGLKYYKLT